MTFQRYNKYVVMKIDDIDAYVNDDQLTVLDGVIETIQEGRAKDGKPACNRYVVVNEDQPYAEVVWKLIELGETDPDRLEPVLGDIEEVFEQWYGKESANE